MIELVIIKFVSLIVLVIMGKILEIRNAPQFLFVVIQNVAELFFYNIIVEIANRIGGWTYYLGSGFIYGLVIYLLFHHATKLKENPYILKLKYHSKEFNIQIAKFSLSDVEHPTLNQFEPLIMYGDGSISRYEKTDELINRILEIQREVKNNSNLQMMITRIDKPSNLYYSFQIFLFSIHDDPGQIINSFEAIEKLELKYDSIERIQLTKISKNKLRKSIYYNSSVNQIMIDPSKLSDLFNDFSFELGKYEFYVFSDLIDDINKNILPNSIIHGKYFIGEDIYHFPVNIDKPISTIFFGREENIPQIMDFEYYEDSVLISDDPALMDRVLEKYSQITALEIDTLFINIVGMNRDEPKFFRKLLSLYEELIPDSIKTGYKSRQIAGKIIEFLELKQLIDPKHNLQARDMLSSKTYVEFNDDLSTDIFSKYNDIFNLALFNKEDKSLIDLLNSPGKKLVSLRSLDEKGKFAVIIILLVLKDQYLVNNHILFSMSDHRLNLEANLPKLSRELELNDVLINLRTVGNKFGWLNSFDMFLCDASFDNQKLRRMLFDGTRNVDRGIYLNRDFRDITILEVEN